MSPDLAGSVHGHSGYCADVGMDPAGVVAALRARDRCAEALGITVVDAGAGMAVVEMAVTAEMCNGHGMCHGGMIFTLADTAMSFASNSHDITAVATAASVEFLQSARAGDALRATAIERYARTRNGVYDVSVERVDGAVVALFRGRTLSLGGSVSGAESS